MRRMQWALVAAFALALSLPAAAAQGRGQGAAKGKPETAGRSAEKGQKGKGGERAKREADEEREGRAAPRRAFGKKQEKKIRDWFANKANLQGLPPGLAKREQLPPGLQRHLEKNGTLPPGLQKRLQPLPQELESRLPQTGKGVRRVVVAGNVILLEERTGKILDIIQDVVPRRSKE
ncbi:MAG: hypothetical protein ACE5HL_10985 [Terriglobia bacterium]